MHDFSAPETVRKWLVRLVILVYWLLVFEGALRKWAFPEYHKVLFFIRDPVVLSIYLLAIIYRIWPRISFVFLYGMAMIFGLGILVVVQYWRIPNMSLIVLCYGWRNYAFYFPLLWIMGRVLRWEDIQSFIRTNLWVAIPMSVLTTVQYYSPPLAWVNSSLGDIVYTEAGKYGGNIIRIIGTFTFFHGYQLYLGSLVIFVLISWIMPKSERALSGIGLILATIATLVMLSLDFTRVPVYITAFGLLAALCSSLLIRRPKIHIRAAFIPLGLLVIALAISLLFFPEAANIRWQRMMYGGDTWYRTIGVFFQFLELFQLVDFAPIGYGIGSTSRGATSFGIQAFCWAGEDEWRRIISEIGPFIGTLYIILRLWIVLWLFQNALLAVRRSNNPLPLLAIVYIGPIIAVWYLTTIGSVHGYGWWYAGFCYALNVQLMNKQNMTPLAIPEDRRI